jgi:peptide/nickel transport system permease protein
MLVSLVIFVISGLLPGDAAEEMLGQSATPEAVAALRREFGLDQPAHERYLSWIKGIFGGDAGHSIVANMPVRDIIADRLPNSMILAGLTTAVAVPTALLIGIVSAVKRGSATDRGMNVATLSMVALPEFLVATLAVLVFAVHLRLLPSIAMASSDAGWGEFLRSYALPVMSLAIVVIAQMARMTRAAVIDQLDRPYVEMAMLKGVSPRRIVLRHVLPNAIGPIANAMALSLSYLLGGAIIVETIFNYPGLASLMVNAVTSRDMALLQTCAMIFCAAYLLLVLIADVVAIFANPRLRAQ